MRTINTDEIIQTVKEMCIEANLKLSEDMEQAVRNAAIIHMLWILLLIHMGKILNVMFHQDL